MKLNYTLLTLVVLLFASCENEIDLYDEFVELPVVYGLVNPSDTLHIIRINKTFMPDYSPVEALNDVDLKTYDSIEVFVHEINNNQVIQTYNLEHYLAPENPYYGEIKNPLYAFKARLKPAYTYELNIKIPENQKTYRAETNIIGKLNYFYSQQFYVDFSTDQKRVIVRWRAPQNATIFILSFQFDYFEVLGNDTTLHSVKQALFNDRYRAFEDDDPMVTVITGKVFYDMIKEQIPFKENVIRIATPPKFEIQMGGEELYDLIVSASVKDIDYPIYENGQYSNIENGQGVFTSIYDTIITLRYNGRTLDSLSLREDMLPYHFRNFIIDESN